MAEWLTYSLTDFLLFSPQIYFRLFELYNRAVWPAQIPAVGLGVHGWVFAATVLASGFVAIVALTRVGIRLFWTVTARTTPRLRVVEAAPVALLISLCFFLAVSASSVMTYLEDTARSLHDPRSYVETVLAESVRRSAEVGR